MWSGMLNYYTIKVGKIFPSRENNSKYGRPPTEKTVYCAVLCEDGIIAVYDFYFIKTFAYLVPKGWHNPGKSGNRCYKNIKNRNSYDNQNNYEKIFNDFNFKLNHKFLSEIDREIILEKL
jgi:hypothetical protein